MNTSLPDPTVVEQLLSAMERHPFGTLAMIVFLMLLFGLALLLGKRS
jgi:ureidoglycolate hydrolase